MKIFLKIIISIVKENKIYNMRKNNSKAMFTNIYMNLIIQAFN